MVSQTFPVSYRSTASSDSIRGTQVSPDNHGTNRVINILNCDELDSSSLRRRATEKAMRFYSTNDTLPERCALGPQERPWPNLAESWQRYATTEKR